MEVGEAFRLISRAIDSDSAANGYLLVGDLDGDVRKLVDMMLEKLFPNDRQLILSHNHPDIAYLGPEGKSRTIHVKSMREMIVNPMAETSYSGGWKVGVIMGADRIEQAAANAFLKSLEEPTPKTMYILATDAPDAVMATVVSRCQRVDLARSSGILDGEWYDRVAEVMNSSVGLGPCASGMAGRHLAEILAELKDSVEDEQASVVRRKFFRTILSFARKWMVEGALPRYVAFRNIERVEEAMRRCEMPMPDEMSILMMVELMVFPKKTEGK